MTSVLKKNNVNISGEGTKVADVCNMDLDVIRMLGAILKKNLPKNYQLSCLIFGAGNSDPAFYNQKILDTREAM